jgi:hypothetical protein
MNKTIVLVWAQNPAKIKGTGLKSRAETLAWGDVLARSGQGGADAA